MDPERINQLSKTILDSAYKIHSDLGGGLFESLYGSILARKLRDQGFQVEVQKRIPGVNSDCSSTLAVKR